MMPDVLEQAIDDARYPDERVQALVNIRSAGITPRSLATRFKTVGGRGEDAEWEDFFDVVRPTGFAYDFYEYAENTVPDVFYLALFDDADAGVIDYATRQVSNESSAFDRDRSSERVHDAVAGVITYIIALQIDTYEEYKQMHSLMNTEL